MSTPPSHNVLTKPLQVLVLVALIVAVLVSCTSKKYVEVEDVSEELVIINQRALSCLDPVALGEPELLPVAIDQVTIGDRTLITISEESVVNLKHNLHLIGGEVEKRRIYINYLLGCLKSIADTSVEDDSK